MFFAGLRALSLPDLSSTPSVLSKQALIPTAYPDKAMELLFAKRKIKFIAVIEKLSRRRVSAPFIGAFAYVDFMTLAMHLALSGVGSVTFCWPCFFKTRKRGAGSL